MIGYGTSDGMILTGKIEGLGEKPVPVVHHKYDMDCPGSEFGTPLATNRLRYSTVFYLVIIGIDYWILYRHDFSSFHYFKCIFLLGILSSVILSKCFIEHCLC
jgi:hypothetical protein